MYTYASSTRLTLTVKTQLAPPNTIDSRRPGFFFSPAVARMVGETTGEVAVRGRKLLFIMYVEVATIWCARFGDLQVLFVMNEMLR